MNKNQQINNIIKQLRNIINNEDVNEKTKYKASCKEVNSDYKTPKYQNIDLNRYQKINNTLICSPEEIAYNLNLISKDKVLSNFKTSNSDYYLNLTNVLD